ncbi:SdpI family protein [Leucobacter viscericola]|uniref:SdpI family protein n=1 Tax=Leucobacter viscericola TaxID=2714935 RepID=A0A6G7XBS0_9MICO|nr:SdpI family protein [Leucobacter viscericola]QIK62005.1 SdpI family protein [Leucobacter viscericola]
MVIWNAMAIAVFATVITILAGHGKIPNNGVVGIRTFSIQRTDETWTEAHRAATPILLGLSIVVVIVGTITLVATAGSADNIAIFIGFGLLGLDIIVLIIAAIRANIVARRTWIKYVSPK